jgi:ATP-dependent Clp protease ATP-binding subunit ClpA
MFSDKLSAHGITDSARHILQQISPRAYDRGMGHRRADGESIVILALYSLLLWERKIGLVALEHTGVDRFSLVRELDQLLEEKASKLPLAYGESASISVDERQIRVVSREINKPYEGWDSDDLLGPLLRQAEQEANEIGHNYVGSEHLVLAILKLADPELMTLLQQHGVSRKDVSEEVVNLLHPGG